MIGSVFGMVSDIWAKSQEIKHEKVLLEIKREDARNGITSEHTKMFAESSSFNYCVGIIVCTYCICCILCIYYPNGTVWTFNPDDVPKKVSIIFGLFSYEWQNTKIYTISTGGVGYALLHPLAFQIGTVITGIRPSR